MDLWLIRLRYLLLVQVMKYIYLQLSCFLEFSRALLHVCEQELPLCVIKNLFFLGSLLLSTSKKS